MKVVVVGMIYKSIDFLHFMLTGLKRHTVNTAAVEVEFAVIANDATQRVLDELKNLDVKWFDYKDPKPNDYYLNRVYRAWNFGGREADGDIICFYNSDMWPSPGWLQNLLAELTPDTIPCSRLVESGKMPSGEHGISQNFGRKPSEFERERFEDFASALKYTGKETEPGGLFMPVLFHKKDFLESGGYPEGNIYAGGAIGAHTTQFVESGDHFFFTKNPVMKQKLHVTVMDSIVYHMQEAEKDCDD